MPEKTIIRQKQLEDGWVEVVEGSLPVTSLSRPCRLWVRRGGKGKEILVAVTDLPVVINQGDTYKVELLNST